MAHFRGELIGNRGKVSKLGTKHSGLEAVINGWNIGIRVYLTYNARTKKDEFLVYKTGGSNGATNDKLIATFPE